MKTLAEYQQAVDENRVIFLDGDVDKELSDTFRKQCREIIDKLKRPDDEIVVVMTTRGGGVVSGVKLYNELRALCATHPVWLVCQSLIASMGIYLLSAVPLERRVAFPYTQFYCHRGARRRKIESNSFEDGTEYEIKEGQADADSFKIENQVLIELLSAGTNLSLEEAISLRENPRYIFAAEAVKTGFVSRILE